ncbi:hypothetical protein ADMFC3_09520 [Geovibrio sp. ADMFC3]
MTHKLPDGWREVKLSDVCTLRGGTGFKEEYQGNVSGEFPFIKVSDMNLKGNETYIHTSNNWVSAIDVKSMKGVVFAANTVVFAKVGAALLLNRRRILTRDTLIDNNMMGATPKELIISSFLYLVLLQTDFGKLVQEGAVPSVNQTQLGAILIPLPPLEEQRKIADILGTVDDKLANIDQQITATENLKKGLMQQLFTKGIGHTEFKQTEIGTIPKAWEVVSLGGLITPPTAGVSVNSDESASNANYGILKTSAVSLGKFYADEYKTIANGEEARARINPARNSIILSRMNTPQLVGESGYVSKDFPNLFLPDRLWQFSAKTPETLCVKWLSAILSHGYARAELQRKATGTSNSMKNIPKSVLLNMNIPLPPPEEQEKIASILTEVDNKLDSLKKRKSAYTTLKTGLMQQLLTGQKRVKVCP